MCQIFNSIGSLTTLKSHLDENEIHDFKSLKEVIEFQKSNFTHQEKIISHHQNLIEQEKLNLQTDLNELEATIEFQKLETEQILISKVENLNRKLNSSISFVNKNFIQKFIENLKQWNYKRKIQKLENTFETEIKKSILNSIKIHEKKTTRYHFITSNFNDAVKQSSKFEILELERKKRVLNELNSYIYGALGEQKVVKTLETLSDEYYLINDFDISFYKPIYNRQENEYIKSIQIDHILIGPSGVFLIETKNWSEKSLNNINLRSPIEQIRRSSYVLFRLLNNEMSSSYLNNHHWGNKKISIKNLLVFTNTKPKEEFQYVKILTSNELLGYINYFQTTLSSIETKRIADNLIDLNKQKTIYMD